MRIFKYELKVDDIQFVSIPKGAKLLTVQTQRNIPCLWAMVDPDEEKEDIRIFMLGTGHIIDDSDIQDMQYIGTFQMYGGYLVFHAFRRMKNA